MEISKGNSQCSYLYPKQAKVSWFFVLSFFFFSPTNSENRKAGRTSPAQSRGLALKGGRRCWG
jgi:hypothetical protein